MALHEARVDLATTLVGDRDDDVALAVSMMPIAALLEAYERADAAGEADAQTWREIGEYLEHQAAIARNRGASARSNRTADLEAMRAGITKAIGALSGMPGHSVGERVSVVMRRIELQGCEAFGLPRLPGRRLVTQVLNQLDTLEPKARDNFSQSATLPST